MMPTRVAVYQSRREKGMRSHYDGIPWQKGLQGLVIGSESHKVLTHNKIPVLVLRQAIVTIFCKIRLCLRTSIASFFEGFFLCAIVVS